MQMLPSRRTFLGLVGTTIAAAQSRDDFDVRSFGAHGDGKALDTDAINKAIQAAAAAGGGVVTFRAGDYPSYSIHLKSNVTLRLENGATLIAAETVEGKGYDAAEPNAWEKYQDFGHSHFHNSLIWGENLANVAITGEGKIWGRGLSRGAGAERPGVGNKSISLKNCHNVLLRDFSVFHGGHFALLANGVDNLTIDNVKVDTNRDGFDIDNCRNVRVSNCSVNSPWDDGICLKSDYALGANRPCEFVTITNCYVSGCWEEGTLLDGTYKRIAPEARVPHTGRIKFGTESNGGFRNITISNCVFEGCQGLALESVDGALLEDVTVTGISMRDIVSAPIFLRLGSRLRAPEGQKVGTLKRVVLSDIVCSGSSPRLGSIISGIPGHEIEDIKISNIQVRHEGGGTLDDAKYVVPEEENAYPEPTMFTILRRPGQPRSVPRNMPSHGFYIRHVKNIEFENVEIQTEKEDQRPAFVLDDVQDADFFRIKAPKVGNRPIFALKEVTDFSVRMCRGVKDTTLEKAAGREL
jgi:polygalacturonase